MLSACASKKTPTTAASQRNWQQLDNVVIPRQDVLMRAIGLIGTPYRYGGNSPKNGFDCSGLVSYVFNDAASIQLPRTTREQWRVLNNSVSNKRLIAGDLLFFAQGRGIDHVGIYVGEGRFVHAPSTGGTVRIDPINSPYWRKHYQGARRVGR